MKRFISIETFVGIILYATTLAMVVIFLPLAWFSNPKTYSLSAVFRSVAGLQPGNRVRVSGVAVGEVTQCCVDKQDYSVKVTFTLHKALKLPIDSRAEITSEGLMGGKSLSLIPGMDKHFLHPGDMIKITRTPLSFEGLVQRFLMESKS